MAEKKRSREDVIIEPEFLTSLAVQKFCGTEIDELELRRSIRHQVNEMQDGDLRIIERHLYAQVITLNAVVDKMLRGVAGSHHLNELQIYGQLALKAQAQSRATLMAIADIKNPNRATFIKQQNNAVNQQVNNHISPQSKEEENNANELLSEETNETLDFSRTTEAIPVDSRMAALGTGNRT